ncbi:hypothetical protein U2F26_31005 [Micromonospora sp. 4G57]|uniref:N-acetyltransferase domain-containing protein n=1 Tax=Micromonospora sicca TaxID=2202420 RepID=A0ABU5JP68_9ACTN|nr:MULTISPECIES: hypothetical protein [unclassified Micromonospora]MDZ5447096.1 hypothetical protein [Micromonospora sp. 4G57]MDZ5494163.1 hypothetical protein [Micromonospora sp. 4G53]
MINNLPVCRAHWHDIPHIVDLVVGPFADSTIGAWLVPDEHRRRDILSAVLRVWTEHALLFGEAYLLQDHSAAAVWLHRYGPLSPPTGYGERLAVACGEYVDRFLHLDDVLHTHRPNGPHNHLAFFTVAPKPYRVRRASTLLATSNARMGQALLPTYTEAATLADRDLYARHGYVPLEPFTLPDGTTTYPMWRTPKQRRRRDRSSTPPAQPDQPTPALNDLPIRLILDTSAILAFTEGSTAVGEAIAKVADEGCLFGLPVMCLAEAARSVTDTDRLDLLVNHPAAAVLTVDPLQWKTLATTHRAVGRLDTAGALLAAAGNNCRVLAEQPGR